MDQLYGGERNGLKFDSRIHLLALGARGVGRIFYGKGTSQYFRHFNKNGIFIVTTNMSFTIRSDFPSSEYIFTLILASKGVTSTAAHRVLSCQGETSFAFFGPFFVQTCKTLTHFYSVDSKAVVSIQ